MIGSVIGVGRELVESFPFAAGMQREIGLGDRGAIRAIHVLFEGEGTVGVNDITALQEDGLARSLFPRMLVKAGKGSAPIDTSALDEWDRRKRMRGGEGIWRDTGTTVGAHAVRAGFTIDMDTLNSAMRHLGRFNARKFGARDAVTLRLETSPTVNAVGGSYIATVAAGGTFALAGTVSVLVEHYAAETGANMRGVRSIARREINIAAASPRLRLPVPDGLLISQVLLKAYRNGLKSNAAVNALSMQRTPQDIRYNGAPWEALQAEDVQRWALLTDANGDHPYPGEVLLDFDLDNNGSGWFNTDNITAGSAFMEFDVPAPAGVSRIEATFYGVDFSR